MQARVVPFDMDYAADFARLNYQWIEQYFTVEPADVKALENPVDYAIATGGEIFFVLVKADSTQPETVAGCVALVPETIVPETVGQQGRTTVFELAKMAVAPKFKGQGLSKLLMQACIDYARQAGASEIMLVTNSGLGPALGLYEAYGFLASASYDDPRYVRGDLQMRLKLC